MNIQMIDVVVLSVVSQDHLMEKYDHIQFMAVEFHTLYYGDLFRTKLLPEKGICFENVMKNLLEFHDRLVAIGWQFFTPNPCKENE